MKIYLLLRPRKENITSLTENPVYSAEEIANVENQITKTC